MSSQSQFPLVSLITINYNAQGETDQFLKSCANLTYPNYQIIVVDNGSRDPFKKKSNITEIKLVHSKVNLGFAGGNNLGLKYSSGEYVIFINNDTIVSPDFIQPIIKILSTQKNAALASPKVLFEDGKTIQYAGAKAINPWTGRGKRLGLGESDYGQYDINEPTELGHGACLAARKAVIDEVGEMPEDYFLYYEEHDWTEQMKNAGYQIYYVGKSNIIHKESRSIGQESPLKAYYMIRSRILYLRRNCKGLEKFSSLLLLIVLSLPKDILKYTFKGQFDLIKATLRGVFSHFKLRVK